MKCAKCACEGEPLWKPTYTGAKIYARWAKAPDIWFCLKCREEWQ